MKVKGNISVARENGRCGAAQVMIEFCSTTRSSLLVIVKRTELGNPNRSKGERIAHNRL